MPYTVAKIDNFESENLLTQMEAKIKQRIEIFQKMVSNSMKGICHKCNNNQEEVVLTEVLLNEIGVTTIPMCEKCRRFWYS